MSDIKVTERDTKATILAAYEKLKVESEALRAENEELKAKAAIAQTPQRKALPPGILRLKGAVGGNSPLWEKLEAAPDTSGENGEKARKLRLPKECFGGKGRQEAMNFMAALAEHLESEGHIPVFRGSYLRVVFRPAPQPPSDSHPDTPSFEDSPEESI